ncbi:MAG: flavodoxin domain-containing protein [Limnochordia bacterium]|jgi:menaquinone-dependent protoporphyrinogen oxidase
MRTLIAYTTRHGTTLRYAEAMGRALSGEVVLADLRQEPAIDISSFDTVVVGGAVYYGNVSPALKEFCLSNIEELKRKNLGLFICCCQDGEPAQQQMRAAYPLELLDAAKVKAILAGEIDMNKMNFIERLIVKLVAKGTPVNSGFDEEAATDFAHMLQALDL